MTLLPQGGLDAFQLGGQPAKGLKEKETKVALKPGGAQLVLILE